MKTRAGKIVWVVEKGEMSRGGRTLGVFSTEALADQFAASLEIEEGFYYVEVVPHELDGPELDP